MRELVKTSHLGQSAECHFLYIAQLGVSVLLPHLEGKKKKRAVLMVAEHSSDLGIMKLTILFLLNIT